MPKTTPKSDRVIMLQNQYVREMRKYGVRGLRYDAAKHSKHEQIERSITPPLKIIMSGYTILTYLTQNIIKSRYELHGISGNLSVG